MYEFTQPIEMRFNELIAGTRGDLAIKVYGDDYQILEELGTQISQILKTIPGSEDVRITQAEGLPTLNVKINKRGDQSLGTARKRGSGCRCHWSGWQQGGTVFEGDRRFDMFVRLPQDLRNNLSALEMLPVLLPERKGGTFLLLMFL